LLDIENSQPEAQEELKNFTLHSVKEFEITSGTKKGKNAYLIFVPYHCHALLAKLQRKLVVELEKKVKGTVFFVAKRTISSKWIKTHKSQMRPRNRTLTAVYEAVLEDLVMPSTILGKRIRVRIDGS